MKDFYCSCRQIEFISHSIWSSSDSSSFCRILKLNIFYTEHGLKILAPNRDKTEILLNLGKLFFWFSSKFISNASSGIKVRLMWILTLLDVEQPLLGHLVLSVELIFPKIVFVLSGCSDLTTLRYKNMHHNFWFISYYSFSGIWVINSSGLIHSSRFSYSLTLSANRNAALFTFKMS